MNLTNHKKYCFLGLVTLGLLALAAVDVSAQSVSINSVGARPDSSAMLDVASNSKGLLIPRMSKSQRIAIINPAQGLMVIQIDQERGLYIYDTADVIWNHLLDSVEIKLLIDSLSDYGIDSVLNLGNDAGGNSLYNLDSLIIGDTVGNYRLHVADTASNLNVNASYGTGMLISSKFNPRIYFENQSNTDSFRLMSLSFDNEVLNIGHLTDDGILWSRQNVANFSPYGRMSVNASISNVSRMYVLRPALDSSDFGPSHTSIYGYRGGTNAIAGGGSSFSVAGVDAAVKGYSFWGNNYTAGVAGYSFLDYALSSAVLGAKYDASVWAALGYNSGGSDWGIYSPNNQYLGGFLGVNTAVIDSTNRVEAIRSANAVTNDFGPDYTTIYGYRGGSNVDTNGGIGWLEGQVDAAIKGSSFWGNNYTAGVAGYNYHDYNLSAAVIGSDWNGAYWGALGYRDALANTWGVYSSGNAYVSGRLSIGNTNSIQPFSIQGNGAADFVGITQNSLAGGSSMELTTADLAGVQTSRIVIRGSSSVPDIEFYTGASGAETQSMHIEGTNGRVGIGTNVPPAMLSIVDGSGAINSGLNLNDGAGNDWYVYQDATYGLRMRDDATDRITITAAGLVGINTVTPAYTLQVNGSVAGTSAYNNTSDGRFKTDVKDIEDGIGTIMALHPVSYDWKRSSYPEMNFETGRGIGFIAQEVEPILPEMVLIDKEGIYSLQYSELIPVLTKAFQEQEKEMERLRQENDELKRILNQINTRLEHLEHAETRSEKQEKLLDEKSEHE